MSLRPDRLPLWPRGPRRARPDVQESGGMTATRPPLPQPPEPPVIHVDALPAGARLAEFEVLSLLGVGGFGMVYRAYDHSLHRTVAIKEYMPCALASRPAGLSLSVRSPADQASFLAGLQSFVAEARLLAQFDHPSLVKVYRFWEENNTAYMAMPLYRGMTLRQARSQMSSPPPEAWLRSVLWSVLEALKVLHENHTLHRDVSPDNIFLQEVGPPVLLDLGAARRAISEKSQKHTAILKVNYAPIEQYADAKDLPQGPWSDLYSLAAVVHGCLCNEPPLPATFRILRDRMPVFAGVAKTVEAHFGLNYSPGFVAAIGHALAIQPADRPQSVQAFAAEMALGAPDNLSKFEWRAGLPSPPSPAQGVPPSVPGPHPSEWSTTLGPATRLHPAATVDLTLEAGSIPSGAEGEPVPVHAKGSPASGGASASAAVASANPGMPGKTMAVIVLAALLLAGVAFWRMQAGSPAVPPVSPVMPAPPLASQGTGAAARGGPASPVPAVAPKTSPGNKAQVPAAEDASAQAGVKKPAPAPAAAKLVRPEAPRPTSSPAVQPAPAELCPDSNFLTRPMCIHLECQKPQFAELPVCVENRKRYPRNAGPGAP